MNSGLRLRFTRVLVTLLFGVGAFLIGSVLIHNVAADGPGKQRARGAPEPIATMTAEEKAERFRPGRPWDGVGQGGLSERALEEFADYPAFWLGASFEGYNLQSAR